MKTIEDAVIMALADAVEMLENYADGVERLTEDEPGYYEEYEKVMQYARATLDAARALAVQS